MAGDCGSGACPVEGGFLLYQPSVAGNAFMVAAFGTLVPVALFLGYRYRTPVLASVLTTGLLLEVLGFVGRLLLRNDVANRTNFALFFLGTILGPTFVSASMFIILPHVLRLYGERASPVDSRHVGFLFSGLSLLTFVVELVGVLFASLGFGGVEVCAPMRARLSVGSTLIAWYRSRRVASLSSLVSASRR
jgi:hypothetical protein